jgi:hypothetical protein
MRLFCLLFASAPEHGHLVAEFIIPPPSRIDAFETAVLQQRAE